MQRDPAFAEAVQAAGRLDKCGRDLLILRRRTLKWLEDLDHGLTVQWAGVGTAKSVSAGLGIAAAVTIFFFPPVGIGLGIGSAASGVATTLGDWIANKVKEGCFHEEMAKDKEQAQKYSANATKLQELLKRLADKYKVPETDVMQVVIAIARDLTKTGVDITKIGFNTVELCTNLAKAGKVVTETGGRASIGLMEGAFDAAQAGRATGDGLKVGAEMAASVTAKTLSIAGAVLSVADAVYSWVTTSPTQATVRKAIEAMRESIKELQIYE